VTVIADKVPVVGPEAKTPEVSAGAWQFPAASSSRVTVIATVPLSVAVNAGAESEPAATFQNEATHAFADPAVFPAAGPAVHPDGVEIAAADAVVPPAVTMATRIAPATRACPDPQAPVTEPEVARVITGVPKLVTAMRSPPLSRQSLQISDHDPLLTAKVPAPANVSWVMACTIPDPSEVRVIAAPPDVAASEHESPDGDLTKYTVPAVSPDGRAEPPPGNTTTCWAAEYAEFGASSTPVEDGAANAYGVAPPLGSIPEKFPLVLASQNPTHATVDDAGTLNVYGVPDRFSVSPDAEPQVTATRAYEPPVSSLAPAAEYAECREAYRPWFADHWLSM
jgi:hypothetical protein